MYKLSENDIKKIIEYIIREVSTGSEDIINLQIATIKRNIGKEFNLSLLFKNS